MRSLEFEALLDMSARVGSNPAMVQGVGGNTSIKDRGTMWIKASGHRMMQARERNLMVPIDLEPLLQALDRDDPACEKTQQFVIASKNSSGLCPSIETTVHALMPARIVTHVHCIETISVAVRADAEAVLAERMRGIPYAFVPYARPGLPLARAIAKRLQHGPSILILGNHGLVVAGETVAKTSALLVKVANALRTVPRMAPPAHIADLEALARDTDMVVPEDQRLHGIATDKHCLRIASGGCLYPDQVVLGQDMVIAPPGRRAVDIEESLLSVGRSGPAAILYPGLGLLTAKTISDGALGVLDCLANVSARIPENVPLRYLSATECAELIGRDAEKYRQASNC